MSNVFTILCLLTLFLWIISSCTRDKLEECDVSIACNSADITYAVDIEPIISVNCAIPNCHGTGFAIGGVTLDTYEKVKAKVDNGRLKARAVDGTPSPMPPAPAAPLSVSEKTIIQNWIDACACP